MKVEEQKKRTLAQNNAMHLYFKQVSDALAEKGLDIETVIKNFRMDISWTPTSVKEILWRHAQKIMYDKESTTELNKTDEITKVWEVLNRFLANLEIESIPFPSVEEEK